MLSIASISAAGISGLQLHSSATALLAPLGKAVTSIDYNYTGEPSLCWLQKHLMDSSTSEYNDNVAEEMKDENS